MRPPVFKSYADMAVASPDVAGLRPVIEKELLHYEILNALMLEGLLKGITFQGGTALRLCHGAVRYSEDLDFSAGPGFSAEQAGDIASAVRAHISQRYELPVEVVLPKQKQSDGTDPVRVSTWSIRIETNPGGRNLPAQRIKIDIDTSHTHQGEPTNLRVNYDFLPQSYGDLLIPTQSLAEIMANKIVAFPSSVVGRPRPRHRDIWDLRWLSQRNVQPDLMMIQAKAEEHGAVDYPGQLATTLERISEIIRSADFLGEMGRFLPSDIRMRTVDKGEWLEMLSRTLKDLFSQVHDGLTGKPGNKNFDF